MIDNKLIDLHQWIVDETERQPAWWVEQTAWAFMAADIVAAALKWDTGWSLLSVAITLLLGTLMIFNSKNPAKLLSGSVGAKPYRLLFVFLIIWYVFSLFETMSIGNIADMLGTFLLTSCHYFAACHPPRPRKRSQAVPQGGAA